jgi:hypothetical protein
MKKRVVELLLIAAFVGSMAHFSRGEFGPTPEPEEPEWMYVEEDVDGNGELDKLSFLTRDRYVFGAIHLGNDVPGSYDGDFVGLCNPRYTVTSVSGGTTTTLLDYGTEDIVNEASLVSDSGGILATEWTGGPIHLTRAMDLDPLRGLMNFTIKNIGSTVLESVTFTETHHFDDFQEVFTDDFDPAGQLIGTNDYQTIGYPVFGMVYAPVPETLTVSGGSYTPSEATFELGDLNPGQSKSVQLSIVWSTSNNASTAREQVVEKMVEQKLQLRVKHVAIDIKPGSFPNSINLGSNGVIPVAILGTDDFDATTVVPETVGFGPGDADPVHWALEDVDGDGDLDFIFHFKVQDTGIEADDTEATLKGNTEDKPIIGTDSVRIVPKGKK